jgi:fructose-1,6-bisphosphatase II / sedoheptulose-1,7-bisphosphatase
MRGRKGWLAWLEGVLLMSTHISVPPQLLLERILTLELVRVTERAAVSAARQRGHGQ